jgi:trehalose synthase
MVTPTWVRQPPAFRPRLLHVSATADIDVAELLHSLTPAQAADGTPVGWAAVAGAGEFSAVTNYLHRLLDDRADPAALGDPQVTGPYRSALAPQARWLAGQLEADDVVVLHDPATLGMAPPLAETGARVVWHCHTGSAAGAARGPAAVWREFALELSTLDAVVTSRAELAPPWIPAARRHVCAPAIDLQSPRNRELDPAEVEELLAEVGLTLSRYGRGGSAAVEQRGPVPAGARVVLQVSRWDPQADMVGVLRCMPLLPADVHLVLAGRDPGEVPDNPEGAATLDKVRAVLAGLSIVDRLRVHLVLTSGRDRERAALLLNALQRRADVVLQKSLAEGFGLTVTEAMSKGRAVVAAAVGGLREQVSPGQTGLLVDPTDRRAVVTALRMLLDDPRLRHELGARAAAEVAGRHSLARLVADYRTFAAPQHAAAVPACRAAARGLVQALAGRPRSTTSATDLSRCHQ